MLTLANLRRFEEARSVLSKVIPMARVFGEDAQETLKMRAVYASLDDGATLDDTREAVAMMMEIKPTMRRVLGGTHPLVSILERHLRASRAVLRAPRRRGGGPSAANQQNRENVAVVAAASTGGCDSRPGATSPARTARRTQRAAPRPSAARRRRPPPTGRRTAPRRGAPWRPR